MSAEHYWPPSTVMNAYTPAMPSAPSRVSALIIQNGDIYEGELGPKDKAFKDY